MARRFSRRRVEGIVEYSESLDELEASAVREDEQALRGTFRLIGLLLGAAGTYGLVKLYGADWPKLVRFIAVLVGACSVAFVFARLAVALRMMLSVAVALVVLGGIGYLVWKMV
jgi:hypothetical protein